MSKREDLIRKCEQLGVKIPSKANIATLENLIATATVPASAFKKVERAKSNRGRKSIRKDGMIALVTNWQDAISVGDTIIVPDVPSDLVSLEGPELHSALTLLRHHFRKYARPAGIEAGKDYSIEYHPEHGATLTRLA